jgi:hypothetical protein
MARMAEKHEARGEGPGDEEEAQCGEEAFTYPRSTVLPRPLGPLLRESKSTHCHLPRHPSASTAVRPSQSSHPPRLRQEPS